MYLYNLFQAFNPNPALEIFWENKRDILNEKQQKSDMFKTYLFLKAINYSFILTYLFKSTGTIQFF